VPDYGKLIVVLAGGQRHEYALSKSEVSIGRTSTSDIQLNDPRASRSHTRLECSPDGCVIVDLGSANGTHVNGKPVDRVTLASGDQVVIGSSSISYSASTPGPEADLINLESQADLDATLQTASLPVRLAETRIPRVVVSHAGHTWEVTLAAADTTIGRRPGSGIVIDSPKVSRDHARIERTSFGFVIEDLNSENGTWTTEGRITRHELADGDTVRIGPARLVYKAGFVEEDLTVVDTRPRSGRRRPVLVVPGYLGSVLYLGSDCIWPNTSVLFSGSRLFCCDEGMPEAEARSVVDEMLVVPNLVKLEQYGRLTHYLEEALGYELGNDLRTFPYDFRQDIRRSAAKLAKAVEDWDVRDPITIVAHSMGSLVSRYYVDKLGGHRRVERLVMLGGPQAGAPETIINLVLGGQLQSCGRLAECLRDVVITHPGVLQLLPTYTCAHDHRGAPIDLLQDPAWLPDCARPLQRNAAEFWSEMRPKPAVPALCVFGYGINTVTGVRMERGADGAGLRVEALHNTVGDGTVPEVSALVEGCDIHPVEQYHGSLHADNDVKKRLKVELTR
jgi:pSer/pThr/pTyr-binding forkhead associated (FHA) protein